MSANRKAKELIVEEITRISESKSIAFVDYQV